VEDALNHRQWSPEVGPGRAPILRCLPGVEGKVGLLLRLSFFLFRPLPPSERVRGGGGSTLNSLTHLTSSFTAPPRKARWSSRSPACARPLGNPLRRTGTAEGEWRESEAPSRRVPVPAPSLLNRSAGRAGQKEKTNPALEEAPIWVAGSALRKRRLAGARNDGIMPGGAARNVTTLDRSRWLSHCAPRDLVGPPFPPARWGLDHHPPNEPRTSGKNVARA